jgi:hypothetical protein
MRLCRRISPRADRRIVSSPPTGVWCWLPVRECPQTQLLDRVFARLRDELDQAGKQKEFNRLKVYLTGEAGAPSYQEAAADLEMSEGAVKVAVHRLRRRYRDLVRDEIAQTVAGPEDVDEELRYLFAALHSSSS